MREALRRLLWLIPTLVAVTILAFGAVSGALSSDDEARPLPLFVNTKPVGVREIVFDAMRSVAAADERATESEATLVRLGGAALPHVLPRLASLSPEGQQRVARALTPVAVRMGAAIDQTLRTTDSAAEFWARFWDEHFVDFNAAIVRRVVGRYADRASPLRKRELLRLDGFALDELISYMNELNDPSELAALARLVDAAAHITDQPWRLPQDADWQAGQRVNARWQSWWAAHRSEYVTLQGVERLLSPLLQTRYAAWVKESVRSRFGILSDGKPALLELKQRAPVTLGLFAVGLLGGTLLGVLFGTLATALRARVARLLETAFGFIWLAIPIALVLGYGAPSSALAKQGFGALLMLLVGTSLVGRYQRTQTSRMLRQEWVRFYRGLGASRLQLALITLRASSNVAVSAMAPHTSTLLTAVFVIEFAFSIDGVGPTTIAALGRQELDWLMLVTIATTGLVGVVQVLSDGLLARLNPGRTRTEQQVGYDA